MGLIDNLLQIAKPYDAARGDGANVGAIRRQYDANGLETVDVYVYGHTALTVNVPYVLHGSGTEAQRLVTAAPATLANEEIVVATETTSAAGYTWVTCKGKCTGVIGSTTAVDTDLLEVLNTGVSFVVDGTSGSSAWSANTVAAQLGASAAAAASIYLFGRQVDVAAT